jgi:hypothetical protein
MLFSLSKAQQPQAKSPAARLTASQLSQLPFTSNMANYLRDEQGFEKRAQGFPTQLSVTGHVAEGCDRPWRHARSQ